MQQAGGADVRELGRESGVAARAYGLGEMSAGFAWLRLVLRSLCVGLTPLGSQIVLGLLRSRWSRTADKFALNLAPSLLRLRCSARQSDSLPRAAISETVIAEW